MGLDVKTHDDLSVTVGGKKYASVEKAIDALGLAGSDLAWSLRTAQQTAIQDAVARKFVALEDVRDDAVLPDELPVLPAAAQGNSPVTGTHPNSVKASMEMSDTQLVAAEVETGESQGLAAGGAPASGAAAKAAAKRDAASRSTSTRASR